jgi:CheY-like chemotaxis protein
VKPVKQSRLFDCLINATVKGPLCDTVARWNLSADSAHSSGIAPELRQTRILLAEDNPINQAVTVGQLRKLGYGVHVVTNGVAALNTLEFVPYDIILMDCQMPELDGYEAARAIRVREKCPDHGADRRSPIHIIALTANAMEGDREKCLAVGMNDYLTKPVRLDALKAALERWKGGAQDQSELVGALRHSSG